MSTDNIRARRKEEKAQPKNQSNNHVFMCLARELVTHPPIQHRGRPEPAKVHVFEFVIAATIAGLARAKVIVPQRHKHSIRVGGKAMNDSDEMMKRDYPRLHPGSNKRQAGTQGYHRARKRFEAPSMVTITVSARQLFRAAGLSLKSLARLPATLHRLREQRVDPLPPLLRGFTKADNGRWTLDVDTRWTPTNKPFARVPWPPPTRQGGATTLSLYLFLFVINPSGQTSIRTEVLYQLGIPTGHGQKPLRDLDHALAGVNKHLRKLNKDGALDKLKQPLPTAFERVLIDGARVHFQELLADTAREQDRADDQREQEMVDDADVRRETMQREEQNHRSRQEQDDRSYFGNMAKRLRAGL